MSEARLQEINNLTADVEAGRIRVRFDEETAWLAILDLRRDNERLRAREAALMEVVRAVAEADNSDHGVCYQLCQYQLYEYNDGDNERLDHLKPCIPELARALLASAAE